MKKLLIPFAAAIGIINVALVIFWVTIISILMYALS